MNKKIQSCLLGLTLLVGLFAVSNTASAQYVVPECNSATLNGFVITNGVTTTAWFEWGSSSSLGRTTTPKTFNSDSNMSQTITGLSENSTYYYRIASANRNGSGASNIISFKTSSCQSGTPSPAPAPAPAPAPVTTPAAHAAHATTPAEGEKKEAAPAEGEKKEAAPAEAAPAEGEKKE